MATYTIQSGDTLSRIAQQNKTTIADLQKLNPQITDINKIYAGASLNLPEATPQASSIVTVGPTPQIEPTIIPEKPIEPEVPAKDITLGTTEVPIPSGGTGANTDAYNKSIQAGLDAAKKAYEDALKTQMDELAKRKAEYEQKITDMETKQEVMLETGIKPLMEPFREKLETTERERLKVEENYFANQKSIGELETLLTSGQAEIEAIRATPGLAAIKTGQINKKAEDITARAGVIEAVMSARNNQISVAYSLIDRSVAAIEADRKDQLSYYEAVYNFYQEKKDVAGKKLITLEKEERDYINLQISDLKAQEKINQVVVDQIKDAMLDPRTADIYEQAGVKLTDTPEEIQKKLSTYTYQQEIIGIQNAMEADGYEYLPLGPGTKPAEEITTMTDSRGKTYTFWKKKEKTAAEIKAEEEIEAEKEKIYTEKDMPPTLRQDIMDTLTDKEGAKTLGRELTLLDMLRIFPNVDRETLQDYMDQFYNYEELTKEEEKEGGTSEKKWWQFWK